MTNEKQKYQRGGFRVHTSATSWNIFEQTAQKKIQRINAFIKNMIQEKLTNLKRRMLHSSDYTLSEKNSTSYWCFTCLPGFLANFLRAKHILPYHLTHTNTSWFVFAYFFALGNCILELRQLLSLEQWCILCDY